MQKQIFTLLFTSFFILKPCHASSRYSNDWDLSKYRRNIGKYNQNSSQKKLKTPSNFHLPENFDLRRLNNKPIWVQIIFAGAIANLCGRSLGSLAPPPCENTRTGYSSVRKGTICTDTTNKVNNTLLIRKQPFCPVEHRNTSSQEYIPAPQNQNICRFYTTQENLNGEVSKSAKGIHLQAKENWTYPKKDTQFYATESDFWTVDPEECPSGRRDCEQVFIVKNTTQYAAALKDIVNSKSQIDCLLSIDLLRELVLLDLLGEKNFQYYTDLAINIREDKKIHYSAEHNNSPLSFLFIADLIRDRNSPPPIGTFTYVHNHPDYIALMKLLNKGGFGQGANVVVLEEDLYAGLSFWGSLEYYVNTFHTGITRHISEIEKINDIDKEKLNSIDLVLLKNENEFKKYMENLNLKFWTHRASVQQIALPLLELLRRNPEGTLRNQKKVRRDYIIKHL